LNHPPGTSSDASRRSYIGWLFGLCGAAVSVVLAAPLIRFTLFPLTAKTTETKWSDVGPVSEFQSSTKPLTRSLKVEQVDGWRKSVSEKVVYVAKDAAGELRVLSAVCPHLGCSVQWQDERNSFICPCHLATYEANGTRTGGPAPRGMDTLETKIEGGRLLVRYQYFRQLVPTKEVIG
jgi:menaquinol-cytochrome c reductase iron-sulfur subunit